MINYTSSNHRSVIGSILSRLSHSVKTTPSPSLPTSTFDTLEQGIIVFNSQGQETYRNASASTLIADDGWAIYQRYQQNQTGSYKIKDRQHGSVAIRINPVQSGYILISEPPKKPLDLRSKTLEYFSEDTEQENIYRRTARALGLSSQWQWIGVSQFLDPEGDHVRLLGWWDKDQCKPPFNVSTSETPCEAVISTQNFCFYAGEQSIKSRFPHWVMADELGAKAYAGLVYYVNGLPKGHIMALHNSDAVSHDMIEDLLQLSTNYLSVGLERARTPQPSPCSSGQQQDRLTGLGNRMTYKAHLAQLKQAIGQNQLKDAVALFANLDDLNKLNNTYDYSTGDQYIQRYAQLFTRHWPCGPYFFRLNSDEFVLLMPDITPESRVQLEKLCDMINQVLMEQFGHQASHGISFLSEHNHSLEVTLSVAERQMYEQKAAHKIDQLHQRSA